MLLDRPEFGDLFLIYAPNLGGFFHTGIVTSLVLGWGDRPGTCETVEAFADGRVMRRSRQFGAHDRFIRWVLLDRRARALAAWLQEAGCAGERVVLLFPPGLDFVAAFFGCLYAGAAAVPAYPPRLNRTDDRLEEIFRDARPRAVLTTSALAMEKGPGPQVTWSWVSGWVTSPCTRSSAR